MASLLTQLTSELRSELSFYHKGVRNITRPGQPHRVGDKIGFQVFVKNWSPSITMKTLSGWIKHAAATAFGSVYFSVATLAPNEEKSLGGEIQADVVANTNDMVWFDRIAIVDAAAKADLSSLGFTDAGVLIDNIQNA